jgi:hypothetical protein
MTQFCVIPALPVRMPAAPGRDRAELPQLYEDVDDPHVSAIRPLTKRKMKISLYVTDLPVGAIPMYSPLVRASNYFSC